MAATHTYNTGVPEKIISDISGHKNLKALHAYERTSTEQQKTAGESIHSGKLFNPETEKENCENSSAMVKINLLLLSLNLLLLIKKEFSSLDQYLGSVSRLFSSFQVSKAAHSISISLTSSFELVRWTFDCFFAIQYSISIMAILNLLPFCCI